MACVAGQLRAPSLDKKGGRHEIDSHRRAFSTSVPRIGNRVMSEQRDDDRTKIALSPRAMASVEEIAKTLGVSWGEAVGRALGTELYLLRFASGDDAVFIEDKAGKHREEMRVKARGDANQGRYRN